MDFADLVECDIWEILWGGCCVLVSTEFGKDIYSIEAWVDLEVNDCEMLGQCIVAFKEIGLKVEYSELG